MTAATNGTNGQATRPAAQRLDRRQLYETVRQKAQAHMLRGNARKAVALMESFWMWDEFGGSDLFDRLRPTSQDEVGGPWVPLALPSDRRHGQQWPVWRNESEFFEYLQQARLRLAVNSYAKGLLRNLTNNTVGKGFAYSAAPVVVKGEEPTPEQDQLCRQAQAVIDSFLRANNFNGTIDPEANTVVQGTREREIYQRVKADGECFLRLHYQDDGTTRVRFVEPERVRSQNSDYRDGWTYGIRHQMEPYEDVETVLAYSIFWPDASAKGGIDGQDHGTWEEVEAREIVHIKGMDTPSTVKRGLSEFLFDTGAALDRAARGQRNASLGAGYRAATGEIWQHTAHTQASITNLQAQLGALAGVDRQTGQPVYTEKVRAPAIRRIPESQELVQPPSDQSESYLRAFQGDLRQAAAAHCAPEFWMAETSSGNYSNLESAAAPAVRNGQCEQEYFKAAYALVVWKALLWARDCGRLPKGVAEAVKVEVEAPAVLHRNDLERAQEDQIGVTTGWKDRQTCAEERGLDWAAVQRRNAEWQAENGPALPGLDQPPDREPANGGGPPKPTEG